MKNYYEILGLNPDGKDQDQKPYSDAAIKKAFRQKSLTEHPDKELDKSDAAQKVAAAKFDAIQEAYKVLSDPSKRAEFDRQLIENPDAFKKSAEEALVVTVSEVSEEKHGSASRELVVRQQVDVTALMASVGYEGSQIVALAEHNLPFAKAVLNNAAASTLLSMSQRLELMLFLCASSSEGDEIFSSPAMQQLLKTLSSDQDTQLAFTSACSLHPVLARTFFKLKPEILKSFSNEVLYILGLEFYEVVQVALAQKDMFKVQEVFWWMAKHPTHQQEIRTAYVKSAHPRRAEQLEKALDLVQQVKEGSFSPEKSEKMLCELGELVFLITPLLEDEARVRPFLKSASFIFLQQKDFKSLIADFKLQTIELLGKKLCQLNSSEMEKIDPKNICHLLDRQERPFVFLKFLKRVVLKETDQVLISFILDEYKSWKGESELPQESEFSVCLKSQEKEKVEVIKKCLRKNKVLFIALLQRKHLHQHLQGNQVFYDRLAALCLHHDLDKKDVQHLPRAFRTYFSARLEFSPYLKKEKDEKGENKPSEKTSVKPARPITHEAFFRLFEKTGFFQDLLNIDIKSDRQVIHHIVEHVLKNEYFGKDLPDHLEENLQKWITWLFKQADDQELERLVKLSENTTLPYFLVAIDEVFNGSSSDFYIAMLSKLIVLNSVWCQKHVSDVVFLGIVEHIKKMWKGSVRAALVVMGNRYAAVKGVKRDMDFYTDDFQKFCCAVDKRFREIKDAAFQMGISELPEEDLDIGILIKLIITKEFVERVGTYQAYESALKAFVAVPAQKTYDIELEALLVSLKKLHITAGYIKGISEKLERYPERLETVKTLIREGKGFNCHHYAKLELQNETSPDSEENQKRLLSSLSLAIHFIQQNKGKTPSELLVKMEAKFGEAILPAIREHKLETKLANAKKLETVLGEAAKANDAFENQKVDSQKIIKGLIDQFEKIAQPSLRPEDQKMIGSYYADLSLYAEKFKDPALMRLRDAYPVQPQKSDEKAEQKTTVEEENTPVILRWIFNLVLSGQHPPARDQVIRWVNNPETVQPVAIYLVDRLRQKKCTFKDLQAIFGLDVLGKVIRCYLESQKATFVWPQDPVQIPQSIICRMVLRGDVSLSNLSQWSEAQLARFSNEVIRGYCLAVLNETDFPIKTETLVTLSEDNYVLFPLLAHGVVSEEELQTCHPGNEAYEICAWVIKNIEWGTFLEQQNRRLENRIEHLYKRFNDLINACTFSDLQSTSLAAPLCAEFFTVRRLLIKRGPAANESLQRLTQIDAAFPRDDKKNAVKWIVNLAFAGDPFACARLVTWLVSRALDPAWPFPEVQENRTVARYYFFIQTHILNRMQATIDRLQQDNGGYFTESGAVQAQQMKAAKTEVETFILGKVQTITADTNMNHFTQAFNHALREKLVEISERPEITQHRNAIGAFLKDLAGLLLAAVFLFLPLLSKRYATFFFKPERCATLQQTCDDLEVWDKTLQSRA